MGKAHCGGCHRDLGTFAHDAATQEWSHGTGHCIPGARTHKCTLSSVLGHPTFLDSGGSVLPTYDDESPRPEKKEVKGVPNTEPPSPRGESDRFALRNDSIDTWRLWCLKMASLIRGSGPNLDSNSTAKRPVLRDGGQSSCGRAEIF